MKLKELHIRNIASIERADIDFDNGLNDSVTGEPSLRTASVVIKAKSSSLTCGKKVTAAL